MDSDALCKKVKEASSFWRAYSIAVAVTVATLCLRLALDHPLEGRPTLIIFMMPVMLSAYVGGLGPGLLSTVLSSGLAAYFVLAPVHTFEVASVGQRWDLLFVAVTGVLISGLNEGLHRARRRASIAYQASAKALSNAESLQRAIFECPNISCVVTDERGIIQVFNRGAERMFDYTADEVVNKVTPVLMHDPAEVAARAVALSTESATPITPDFEGLVFKATKGIEDIFETTMVRKDQSSFPAIEFVTGLRNIEDSVIGYLFIGIDNTARQQVEEVRKRFGEELQSTNRNLELAKSAAEKANLAKSEFVSNMSHELRTPLNAILGFAQLMESADPPPDIVQKKSLEQILQGGWYLLKLINEILDLATIESGRLSLSKESVSVCEILSTCRNLMEAQAQQRGIVMLFPSFDTPVYVRADHTRLKQILLNLLSNALKYNCDQGTVIVECVILDGSRVRISVKDTGAGLDPEQVEQLFTPFNRLGQENGTVVGTGIGLVMCKRLAELMDGTLGVESIVREGSTFWCELPVANAPVTLGGVGDLATIIPSLAIDGSRKKTLLYIEDNPANLQLVEAIMKRFPDLKLMSAGNAMAGIELVRSSQPQIVLMDINLPGISGSKALKILQQDPSTSHIPIVAVSANAMPSDIEKGLKAGFFRYLTKPLKIQEFTATVNAALKVASVRVVSETNK